MPPWEELAGNLVGVPGGTPAQLEHADSVVCVPDDAPNLFPDDVHTTCADCGVGIHHRPWMPARPPKVCLACGLARGKEAGKP